MAKGQQRIEQGNAQAEEGEGEDQRLAAVAKGRKRGLENLKNS